MQYKLLFLIPVGVLLCTNSVNARFVPPGTFPASYISCEEWDEEAWAYAFGTAHLLHQPDRKIDDAALDKFIDGYIDLVRQKNSKQICINNLLDLYISIFPTLDAKQLETETKTFAQVLVSKQNKINGDKIPGDNLYLTVPSAEKVNKDQLLEIWKDVTIEHCNIDDNNQPRSVKKKSFVGECEALRGISDTFRCSGRINSSVGICEYSCDTILVYDNRRADGFYLEMAACKNVNGSTMADILEFMSSTGEEQCMSDREFQFSKYQAEGAEVTLHEKLPVQCTMTVPDVFTCDATFKFITYFRKMNLAPIGQTSTYHCENLRCDGNRCNGFCEIWGDA